ncbi:MAG: ATP-dependent sacrificial sulfur transferase LarE [Acidimicrobiia bacterium]|nr:ATP-dependent sacrificial sulfur transferase LarE [Acidimicrobiia bacterium]
MHGGARSAEAASALEARSRRLFDLLRSYRAVIVAFSGGVDSAFLAWAATRVLGDRALCLTADSPSYPDHHRQLALRVARAAGLRHEFVRTGEMERAEYRANPVDRCYYCKEELYETLQTVAASRDIGVIVDGNNADDRGDYRPGRRAAAERGVRSPLDEAGLTKADIRELSRRAGLPTWDEPASACLSSRIPYHTAVTVERLQRIERAEDALRSLGFRVCRVRHYGAMARVELGADEMSRLAEPGLLERIVAGLVRAGYRDVTLDLLGYRTGSLNDGIVLRQT